MSFDTFKAALVDELFTNGRVWKEGVDFVSSALSGLHISVDEDLTKAVQFGRQVSLEFAAVSHDLDEVSGAIGASKNYVQTAGELALKERYLGDGLFPDWRLWNNRGLRGRMMNALGAAYRAGKVAEEAGQDMSDVIAAEPATVPVPASAPDVPLPSSLLAEGARRPARDISSIGCFGNVAFEVSPQDIFTLSELSRKRDAVYAEHKVINSKPRLQFLRCDLWEVSIRIVLSRNWTDPEARIEQLVALQESGGNYPLVLGGRNLGVFVLKSFSEVDSKLGRFGEIERAEVELGLKEYEREKVSARKVARVRAESPAPIRRRSPARKLAVTKLGGR